MSALMLLHKGDDGQVLNIPFTYRHGGMSEIVEEIVATLIAVGAANAVWEGVGHDRLGVILDMRQQIRSLTEENARLKEVASNGY